MTRTTPVVSAAPKRILPFVVSPADEQPSSKGLPRCRGNRVGRYSGISRKPGADPSRRPPLSITMLIRQSLSALEGATLSTSGGGRASASGSEKSRGSTAGVRFTCTPAWWHKRACCRVLASSAPRVGHVTAKCSSTPNVCRPACRNCWAGLARRVSTGLAHNDGAAPGSECPRCLL